MRPARRGALSEQSSMISPCVTCNCGRPPIEGSGPEPCRILFVGEGPGIDEHMRGQVFVGRSGRELNLQYLPLAGLVRTEVRATNIFKPFVGRNPTGEEAAACAGKWLPRELRHCQPEIVVTLGAIACKALFPKCDLALEHGLPRWDRSAIGDWEGTHIGLYHPAAGLHEGSWMIPLQTDFANLRLIQRGEWTPPHAEDEYPDPLYTEIERLAQLEDLLLRHNAVGRPPVAMDTEFLPDLTPYCMSGSFESGTGWVIQARRRDLLEPLFAYLHDTRPLLVMHPALVDLDVLERMGANLDYRRVFDTMVRAYHLGNLPQGLKALAYRLCGMRMHEFEDLVRPYAEVEALDYLEAAGAGLAKSKTLNKVKRALRDFLAGSEKVNLWDRWKRWNGEDREAITGLVGGPMPVLSIGMVPWPKTLWYSARDADATLRVYGVLRRQKLLARS